MATVLIGSRMDMNHFAGQGVIPVGAGVVRKTRIPTAAEAALESLLSHCNPDQRAAAHHGHEPLLNVGGAGTGKTTTTTAHREASLIARDIDPGRILLLTFTRRSAAEMLRRVDSLLVPWWQSAIAGHAATKSASREVWGGTFQAVATRL